MEIDNRAEAVKKNPSSSKSAKKKSKKSKAKKACTRVPSFCSRSEDDVQYADASGTLSMMKEEKKYGVIKFSSKDYSHLIPLTCVAGA